ncbi:hypothetical protein J2S43_004981 [Catenuloplanes nepalensis]|uniref:Uncharacterized protein n=1 Tax=Catenuloplanes nepalensis TaxID=587533 RepID=A0ABT9MYG2_9ACTN|nr:hypothetical protein [Catenuloplanes nepalensis]MDP9796469.1 hypothetical protein [Catenuloplanes nepalensis]
MSDTGAGLVRLPAGTRAQQQWLLSLLPAFPLVLLVLRLWYLSRQDLTTMLLLVQYVSPLGLVTSLTITLVWVLPAVVLLIRVFGTLLLISAPSRDDACRSLLAVVTLRMPDWTVVIAVLLAAITWQMRFLPTLLMLTLMIIGLTTWLRRGDDRAVLVIMATAVPVAVGLLAYVWLGPAIMAAFRAGETINALLLAVPPAVAPILTGPIPAGVARLGTHWAAVAASIVAPFAVGVLFMRAPILPDTAIEAKAGVVVTPEISERDEARDEARDEIDVWRGRLITVDDSMVTLMDADGRVRFIPSSEVLSRTLCPEAEQVPSSAVYVQGWYAEDTALEWMAPKQRRTEPDPRCQGRPVRAE